jgi:hypothetical protein
MGKAMKVKFKKDYGKFTKGQIAKLHWTFANELLAKKIVTSTSETTIEDIELNKLKDDGNNG